MLVPVVILCLLQKYIQFLSSNASILQFFFYFTYILALANLDSVEYQNLNGFPGFMWRVLLSYIATTHWLILVGSSRSVEGSGELKVCSKCVVHGFLFFIVFISIWLM
jgi:hypothetical protein